MVSIVEPTPNNLQENLHHYEGYFTYTSDENGQWNSKLRSWIENANSDLLDSEIDVDNELSPPSCYDSDESSVYSGFENDISANNLNEANRGG